MGINPFDYRFIPYNSDLARLGRELDILDLDTKCCSSDSMSFRYISPRGMGKTTLLESYFSTEKCQELAQDHRRLVYICSFSGDKMRTETDVYNCLIDAVNSALFNLDCDSPDYRFLSERIAALEQKLPNYQSNSVAAKDLLNQTLVLIKRKGYQVTLVLDEFHQLACAKSLESATFSTLAAFSQDRLISYIVSSDYDDSVGSDTYYISPFARIFSSSTTHIDGITSPADRSALMELIRQKVTRFPQVTFSDRELQTLIDLTAGIPGLLQDALKDIFEVKLETAQELDDSALEEYALSACTPLMEKWVQYFTDAHWETIQAVIDYVAEDLIKSHLPQDRDVRECLTEAGLVIKVISRRSLKLVCPLFELFILRELPRRKKPEPSILEPVLGHPGTVIYVEAGAKLVQGDDKSNNLTAQNLHIHQGLSAAELLTLISADSGAPRDVFANRLADQLRQCLTSAKAPQVQVDTHSQTEYEQLYDKAFDEYSKGIVQDVTVDEDNELTVTPTQLLTLDARFADARSRCRSNLTDEFLATQSERCQFYLKLSVVVEDALELPGIQMEDYSPQLVLYGKALEQSLRDNFYTLFHKEPVLSVYDTFAQKSDSTSAKVFANTPENLTLIGGYTHLISAQKAHLANLCLARQFQVSGIPSDNVGWINWWDQLQRDIYAARGIRNMADHADTVSPDRRSLDNMCKKLLGNDTTQGILERTVLGKQLQIQMFPPQFTFDVVQSMLAQSCTMLCTLVKTNGGVKGYTCEGNYPVNVSPKRVLAFCNANGISNADLANKKLNIKILEHNVQNNSESFGAEILSISL